ncbi:MAG: MerR family transcriptional regulator [Bowdeniella nasicola]|nr:MerR family transcriptional regulator [Bowdeniella nasicola]
MSIGEAVATLKPEFPAMKPSKLRFIEDEGLVRPHRTASGYRKYSLADIQRVRYVLIQQRDHFRPLAVIGEQLAELDQGREPEEEPTARVVSVAGRLVRRTGSERIGRRELADLSGVSSAEIEECVACGIIKPDRRGRFHVRCIEVVAAIADLARFGIEPRHLHHLRQASSRNADLVNQVVAPLRAGTHAAAQERSDARAADVASVLARLAGDLTAVAVGDALQRS